MIYLALAAFLAANIAALVGIARHYRADHDEHDAEWAGECLRLWWERESVIKAFSAKYAEQARAVIEAEEQVYRAADDLEWEQIQHAVTQAERDMYRTAFRGEYQRQVNAELLHPDEPVGTATVIDWPVAEVVPLRKGRAK
jgi:hypothetical protein